MSAGQCQHGGLVMAGRFLQTDVVLGIIPSTRNDEINVRVSPFLAFGSAVSSDL
jgi:hypothetical protein